MSPEVSGDFFCFSLDAALAGVDPSSWAKSLFDYRTEWEADKVNAESTNYYTIAEVIR